MTSVKHLTVPLDALEPTKGVTTADVVKTRLLDSIRARGQLVPLLVRALPGRPGRWQVVAGNHRLFCLRATGRPDAHCIDLGELTEAEAIEVMFGDNAYRRTMDRREQLALLIEYRKHTKLPLDQIAARFGLKAAQACRLTNIKNLHAAVLTRVLDGHINPSVGYLLSTVRDQARQQELADAVVADGLSRDEVQQRVRELRAGRAGRPATGRVVTAYEKSRAGLERLAAVLKEKLAAVSAALSPKLPLSDAARVAQAVEALERGA